METDRAIQRWAGKHPTTTDYVHRIQAGSATVLVVRSTGTNNGTYYVTQDHLGSASVITDSAGTVVVNESFAAFGTRRAAIGPEPRVRGIGRISQRPPGTALRIM